MKLSLPKTNANLRASCLVFVAVGAFAAVGEAGVITYAVTGQVDAVLLLDSEFPSAFSGVTAGDAFEILVTFDPAAASDSDPDPAVGRFSLPVGSYTAEMRLGTATAALDLGAPLIVSTTNDFVFNIPDPPPPIDSLELHLGDESAGFLAPSITLVSLIFDSTAFATDAIPTSVDAGFAPPPATPNFSYASYLNLSGGFRPRPSVIAGGLSSFQIIPSPSVVIPLVLVGSLMGSRRRD